jgi:hypothetical protein
MLEYKTKNVAGYDRFGLALVLAADDGMSISSCSLVKHLLKHNQDKKFLMVCIYYKRVYFIVDWQSLVVFYRQITDWLKEAICDMFVNKWKCWRYC